MTDMEMVRLCAEAMGLNPDGYIYRGTENTLYCTDLTTGKCEPYEPLNNDAQADALLEKIGGLVMDKPNQQINGRAELRREIVTQAAKRQAAKVTT